MKLARKLFKNNYYKQIYLVLFISLVINQTDLQVLNNCFKYIFQKNDKIKMTNKKFSDFITESYLRYKNGFFNVKHLLNIICYIILCIF